MHRGRVLIIEDHDENRALFRTVLEHYGYAVEEASDGISGLDALRCRRPDVVILDLGLPRMDGTEVARRIRADAALRDVPVLVLTADVSDRTRRTVLDLGAREFLTKPIRPADLRAAVDRNLRAGQPGRV